MPYQHISEIAAEVGSVFWAKKQITLIGLGMVAEKVIKNPNYRMWATIVGMTLAGILQLITLTFTMDTFFENKIAKQTNPIIDSIVDQRAYFELKHSYTDQKIERAEDLWEIGRLELINVIEECKSLNKEAHSEIKDRIKYLEQH